MKLHKFVLNQDRALWKEQRPMDPTGSVSYTIFYLLQTYVRLGLQPILCPLRAMANNKAGLLAVRFFVAFSQSTYIVVSSLQLIHGSLISLTDFLGSCAQAGYKLTARFFSLSSTSAFSRLTTCYYTCSY